MPAAPTEFLRRGDKTVIFISGGGTFQNELCDYVRFLKSCLDSDCWSIVIKPHPMEDRRAYTHLLESDFVTLSNQSAYELLAQAAVHISVYSTLLYEAVRYSVANYVLLVDDPPDICYAILDSGVALPLQRDQLPDPNRKPKVDPEFYFAEFNPSALFES